MEFLQVAECLFSNIWALVTSVEYPGTGVPVAAIFVGVFLIGLSIGIIRSIFSSGGSK